MPIPHMHLFRHQELLLLLILMLGLQFCCPLSAQARDQHPDAMECCVVKEAFESEAKVKDGLVGVMAVLSACSTSENSAIPGLFVQRTDDRVHLDVLPATGLFPSAP